MIRIKEFLIELINLYLGDDQSEPIEEKTKTKEEETEDWWWTIGGK